MTTPILDLSGAPEDPIERLVWLDGVKAKVAEEMNLYWSEAYFWARFQGQFDTALALNIHSRKKILAFTRARNERAGRMIRWNDGR